MNQATGKLKTAIVGCGAISRKHIEALHANGSRFHIVGVFDIDAERAASAAALAASEDSGTGCRSFTSMEQMADACEPDVVAIATPSALHADQAIYWMERGAHIVLEKPVALSSADIDRIAAAQARTGRQIVVGYVLRYSPHVRLVAKALDARRFGRVLHAGLAVYWNRNDDYYRQAPWRGTWANDGGSLMNQATHGIDLLQWVLGGRPVEVSAQLARYLRPIEADDFAAATVRFDNGAIGTVQATVCTYPTNLGARLTIIGENGTVELSGNNPDTITAWRFPEDAAWKEIDAAIATGVTPGSGDVKSGHAGVYDDLARAVTGDAQPVTGFASSRVSAEIVLGIQKSHRDRAAVGFPVEFASADMAGADL